MFTKRSQSFKFCSAETFQRTLLTLLLPIRDYCLHLERKHRLPPSVDTTWSSCSESKVFLPSCRRDSLTSTKWLHRLQCDQYCQAQVWIYVLFLLLYCSLSLSLESPSQIVFTPLKMLTAPQLCSSLTKRFEMLLASPHLCAILSSVFLICISTCRNLIRWPTQITKLLNVPNLSLFVAALLQRTQLITFTVVWSATTSIYGWRYEKLDPWLWSVSLYFKSFIQCHQQEGAHRYTRPLHGLFTYPQNLALCLFFHDVSLVRLWPGWAAYWQRTSVHSASGRAHAAIDVHQKWGKWQVVLAWVLPCEQEPATTCKPYDTKLVEE